MRTTIYETAQGLASLLGYGTVAGIEQVNMAGDERGWSGAEVVRKMVSFQDGSSKHMVFKSAGRSERCAMKLLTEQRQCTPAAYSQDIISSGPEWMAMEDLGPRQAPNPEDHMWLRKVAKGLASIHAANMGKENDMPWLPTADETYWNSVVTQLSVAHFERRVEEDPAFAHKFGEYLPRLQDAGRIFANDMAALYREKEFLTLTHGDLQMRDGVHIYHCDGAPRIIDFGFCRYAPFYIDLAGWFTADDIRIYYDELTSHGIFLRYSDFEERARAAFRYNGFIYLCPSVMDWRDSPDGQTGKRLLQSLKIILSGDFPERRIQYSEQLFQKLAREFQ